MVDNLIYSVLEELSGLLYTIKNDFHGFSSKYDLIIGAPIKEIGKSIDDLIPTFESIDDNIRKISNSIPTIENIDDSLVRIANALERIADKE